jgi:hypothetical protein
LAIGLGDAKDIAKLQEIQNHSPPRILKNLQIKTLAKPEGDIK